MITRKKFITLTSLGLLSTLIPINLFSSVPNTASVIDLNALLKQAADYRKAGKFFKARTIYEQIIASYPAEIRAYDGIRKLMLAKGKQEFEVIKVYKSALQLNPGNVTIKERLFKEYFKAAIGNKRVSSTVNLGKRTLLDVKEKYENFLANHPNKKTITKQLEKINRMIDSNIDNSLDARKNTKLKAFKKQQRKLYKSRFENFTIDKIDQKLSKLLSKQVSVDRKRHIRELYQIYIIKLKKDKNYALALEKSLAFYQFDSKDSLPLKMVRDLSKYTKNYDELIRVERSNHALKNNFWSGCALFDAIYRKNRLQFNNINSELEAILSFLETNISEPAHEFEFKTRKIKVKILKNDNSVKEDLMDVVKGITGTSATHTIDRVNVLVANYYGKISIKDNIKKIIEIAEKPKAINPSYEDELLKFVAQMNYHRVDSKPIHLESLRNQLFKLQQL